MDPEQFKWEKLIENRARYFVDWSLESFKHTVDMGFQTSKTLLLLNGAAAGAVMALMGSLAKNSDSNLSCLIPALWCFGLGALFAGGVTASTYVAQGHFSKGLLIDGTQNKAAEALGEKWRKIAIWAGLISCLQFVIGILMGGNGLDSIFSHTSQAIPMPDDGFRDWLLSVGLL